MRRVIRYLVAGGFAAVLFYGVFAAGWMLLAGRLPYLAVAVLANVLCAPPIYQIYRSLVFRVGGRWLPGFARFYVLSLGSLLVNLIGLPLLVEVAGLPVLLAQALVIVGSPLVNYQLARLWAFRAVTTKPLAATPASGCRASTTSSSLSGDNTHISGTSSR
jgi:putative flippase GtrA